MRLLTTPALYALLAALVASGAFGVVKTVQLANERAAHAGYRAQAEREFSRLATRAAAAYRELIEARARIDDEVDNARVRYHQGVTDGRKTADDAIADLAAGNRVLHARLRQQCPAGTGAGTAAPTAGGGDGAGVAGLSDQDAGFLVRFAGDADDVVRRLTLCQAYSASLLAEWPQ